MSDPSKSSRQMNAESLYNQAVPSIITKVDRLIYAIRDDDVETFKKLGVPFEEYINLSFDHGMNILNFAIDQERM